MPSPLILVVDDAADTRAPLVRLLELHGYRAFEAENGQQALAALRDHPETGLVLLDLFMPTLDGWAFRNQQLHDPDIAHIPVVVFSVASGTELIRYPLRAHAVLRKPTPVDDIFAVVEACCGPGRSTTA